MKSSQAFTLVELIVVLMILGMLAGLLIPTSHPPREAGRREACKANIEQIVAATKKYEKKHGSLPAVFIDKDGKPLYSWRVLLLPYLGKETKKTYDMLRLDEPWDSEHNMAVECPAVYQCKSSIDDKFLASYILVVDRKQNEDGSPYPVISETLPGVRWMQPVDLTREDIDKGPRHLRFDDPTLRFDSNHPGMAMLGMSDGSVQTVIEVPSQNENSVSGEDSDTENDEE